MNALAKVRKEGWWKDMYGIERSFAEAKVNHGLRFARMLGIQNMREQCFLTAAVQNIKRLVKAFFPSSFLPFSSAFSLIIAQTPDSNWNQGFVDGLRSGKPLLFLVP